MKVAVVAGGYLAASLITFGLYAVDKRAAQCGRRRISEATLQGWTWLGGFAGALAGQAWLRHKSRRPGLILGAWGALVLHAVAWGCWISRV